MERRALIALALSFVVFMAFMYYGEMTKRPAAPSAVSQKAPAPAGSLRRLPGGRDPRRPGNAGAGEGGTGPSGQGRGGGNPLV